MLVRISIFFIYLCSTMAKKIKLPSDINKKAKSIVDALTNDKDTEQPTQSEISRIMSAMGKKGGKIGGKARAKVLTPAERSAIAKKAAAARWGTKTED